MRRATSLVAIGLGIALVTAAPRARAEDRKTEAAAQEALDRAHTDYEAKAYDKAIGRLQKAARACGAARCRPTTLGSVFRDLGVILLRRGDADGAASSFAQALQLAPELSLPAHYAAADVRAEWDAARDEASVANTEQPSGELAHTPAAEQTVRTPLPVFVADRGEAAIAKVVVKYRGSGATDFRTVTLEKVSGGWGGVIPCGEVTRGVLRYYLQGFDASGSPTALSGSPKRPFFVPIRAKITGAAPSLPGRAPPAQCDAGAAPAAAAPETRSGDECVEDAQCQGGTCHRGTCVEPAPPPPARNGDYPRLWIGLGGSVDVGALPTGLDVCKLTSSAAPQNGAGYYCTTPGGSDFPARKGSAENDSLASGAAGSVARDVVAGNVRATVSADYALNASLLLGGAIGYVARAYPGKAAIDDGKAFALPLHFEIRATYLIGDEPLAHTGLYPYVVAAAGAADFDLSTNVTVQRTGIPGDRTMTAWVTGGPWFVALAGGGRYALSSRAAALAGVRVTGAFGGSGFLPLVAPELSVQYGF